MVKDDYRPISYSEVVGQEIPKKVLKVVSKNPDISPHSMVLEGSWGTGKCVTGETLVLTDVGVRLVKDLFELVPEKADSFTAVDGFNFYSLHSFEKVSHFYFGSLAETVEVGLSLGLSLEGTEEHPVLSMDSNNELCWTKISLLKEGDKVVFLKPGFWQDSFERRMFDERDEQVADAKDLKLNLSNAKINTKITELWHGKGFKNGCCLLFKEIFSTLDRGKLFGDLFFLRKILLSSSLFKQIVFHQDLLMSEEVSFDCFYLDCGYVLSFLKFFQTFCACFGHYFKIELKRDSFVLRKVKLESYDFDFSKISGLPTFSEFAIDTVVRVFKGRKLKQVYDFTIPSTQAFVSNGLISHNTSLARIFSKSLNCLSFKSQGDVCNSCVPCKEINSQRSFYYVEFDSAVVGSVDKIRELREVLSCPVSNGYRLVVLDECHLLSKQAQSSFLKILEETPRSVFFLFPTTDVQKLLSTIRSRSVELHLELLTEDDVKFLLRRHLSRLNLSISDTALQAIVQESGGHGRDAVNLLKLVYLVGEEDFLKKHVVYEAAFDKWLESLVSEDSEFLSKIAKVLCSVPSAFLKQLADNFFKKLCDCAFVKKVGYGSVSVDKLEELVFYYLKNRVLLSQESALTPDWYIFFLSAKRFFRKEKGVRSTGIGSRFSK